MMSYLFFFSVNRVEDTKGVIRRIRTSKDRQHNGQKEKGQKDIQQSAKHTHKTKDRVTQTPLKTGENRNCRT